MLGRRGGVCPNLRAFFKIIMMHCNVSLKDVESVKNVYFAIAGSDFSCLAMNLRSLHQSSINVYHTPNPCHLNMRFLTKRHVEMNPSRGSRGSDFLCSGRFSEPSCIHVCFAGMNFVFDKGHIAHKGIHDHFKSQVFVNKQGWQTIYVRRIQRQAWQFVVPAKLLLEIGRVALCDWVAANHGHGSLRLLTRFLSKQTRYKTCKRR